MKPLKLVRAGSAVVEALSQMGVDVDMTSRVLIDIQAGELPVVAVYRTASDEDLAHLISKLPNLIPPALDSE